MMTTNIFKFVLFLQIKYLIILRYSFVVLFKLYLFNTIYYLCVLYVHHLRNKRDNAFFLLTKITTRNFFCRLIRNKQIWLSYQINSFGIHIIIETIPVLSKTDYLWKINVCFLNEYVIYNFFVLYSFYPEKDNLFVS